MRTVEVDVPGHDRWFVLPLDGDVDVTAAEVVNQQLAAGTGQDAREDAIADVAGHSRLARQGAEAAAQEGVDTLGALMLIPGDGTLVGGPVAMLRVMQMPPEATADDALELLVDLQGERYGELTIDELDTASGPALSVRVRPVVEVDGEREVHEHRVVFWARPELEVLVALSLYTVDLMQGGQAAEPLLSIARSVAWHPA